MTDWTKQMSQTFEYYVVDPATWRDTRRLTSVRSCTLKRDRSSETRGSATFDVTEDLGECYVRAYLVAGQNGSSERVALGTYLVQTPSTKFDGRSTTVSLDAYTPLIELKENPPPLGYSLLKGEPIMERAYLLCRERMRAPISRPSDETTLTGDFVSNTSDTWLSFVSDLVSNAKFEIDVDELGRGIFSPRQEASALQPVWTFDDGNSSILYSDITVDRDLYGVPNVVEVVYSDGEEFFSSRVTNERDGSPTSIQARGREILYRDTSPSFSGVPNQRHVDEYAQRLLEDLSSLEYTLSYSHGYCPVRVGDCVRLDYERAGIMGVKARVASQSIKCEAGCKVTETATFTVDTLTMGVS